MSLVLVALASCLCLAPPAQAQPRPYIGFAYPAGGQQGTTFQIRLGGQGLDDVHSVLVTGSGVAAKVVEYRRRMNNEEMQLLREQLRELKRTSNQMSGMTNQDLRIARIEERIADFVPTPACPAISTLTMVEVTIARNAMPGRREIRLVTLRGVSNPLAFHVGQMPEFSRKPMRTATLQVLGKEAQSLRHRPSDEAEDRIVIPCTVNGQIASGEVNRYRFEARKGQRLIISTLARQLIPFIADAVPGWFQPALTLYDGKGKELAFSDDYRSQPDPVILFEVPADGEYVFAITDALYRGREDFVYRITIGEMPFVTSIFPLGGKTSGPIAPKMTGWNLQDAVLVSFGKDAKLQTCSLAASRKGILSNPVPFALDDLPEALNKEPNDAVTSAQKLTLPVIVNGHIGQPEDWDVFQFTGKSNDIIVAEVQARRLASPLDSVIKLTDAAGHVLAFNDDREDPGAGVNTHHADSWFMFTLPGDGDYFVHIGDTADHGGEEYAYRLRLSAPEPDFELRVVPSSIRVRPNATVAVAVYVQRKDGFTNSIKLELKDPPLGFTATPVKLVPGRNNAALTIQGPPHQTKKPVNISVVGTAKVGEKTIWHEAVPADDQMQAFLWRHLVPASDLRALAYNPAYEPPPKRIAPTRPPRAAATRATDSVCSTNTPAGTNAATVTAPAKPKFTQQQIARRLRELERLYEEDFLTDEFYLAKVAECDAGQ